MSDILNLLDRCESLIRSGQLSTAATLLSAISANELPRALRFKAANLCRRTGKVPLGLRILTPVIHPKTKASDPASPNEIAEYAVLLQRAGGVREALQRLQALGDRGPQETGLYRAYCHFSQWNYNLAIPELDAYLAQDLPAYARIVGEVNLASALISAQEDERAQMILSDLLTKTENAQRLRGNCFEMKAQLEIRSGRFEEALRSLDHAMHILTTGWDNLFAQKWQSFIKAKLTGDTRPLLEIRERAFQLRHFETLRDVDHLLLHVRFEEERFDRLYFGSPLKGYRKKLLLLAGHPPKSESYVNGSLEVEPLEFTQTGKLNHLLQILSRDLYRPVNLGTLFAELFPSEHFDIFHSPNRVHQLLRRGRRHLEEIDADIRITGDHGGFQLQLGKNAAVRLHLQEAPSETFEVWLRRLQTEFPHGAVFNAKEACARIGISKGQFRRFALWAQDKHYLQTGRTGPATIYEIEPSRRAS